MSNWLPNEAWQEFYKAALFESDESKATERIADAEQIIVDRARSLFHHPDSASAECDALEATYYAPSVLKCYTHAQQNEPNEAPVAISAIHPNA